MRNRKEGHNTYTVSINRELFRMRGNVVVTRFE